MARLEKVFGLSALMLLATMAAAQTPPDFSGRWTALPEPPAAGGGRSGGRARDDGQRVGRRDHCHAERLHAHRGTRAVLPVRHAAADAIRLQAGRLREPQHHQHGPGAAGVRLDGRTPGRVPGDYDYLPFQPSGERSRGDNRGQAGALARCVGSLVITTTRSGFAGGPPSTSTTTYKRI